MPTADYMLGEHVAVFRAAAKHFNVFIGVRRTNPASLAYMKRPGYVAKRLDCKPKTADYDVLLGARRVVTAGLVTDPTVVGPRAYAAGKYEKAMKAWEDFAPLVGETDGQGGPLTYIRGGKVYAVQKDETHRHYGCVMFSSNSLVAAANYIHGDYDLYAIVPADNPSETRFVREERLGQPHARSRELTDVQIFINGRIGRPMVLHGDQEKYADHSDEDIDVFFPDGTIREVLGRNAIAEFYRTVLKGRLAAGQAARTAPAGGLWVRVVR